MVKRGESRVCGRAEVRHWCIVLKSKGSKVLFLLPAPWFKRWVRLVFSALRGARGRAKVGKVGFFGGPALGGYADLAKGG